jgi:hypothetical protein
MKILFIKSHIHHKNLHFILQCKQISFYIIDSINQLSSLDLTEFDCVYSPCHPIDVSNYPTAKFIFGPQFSIFPTDLLNQIKGNNSVYNLLSDWVVDIWSKSSFTHNLKLITLPFGVDTDKFINIKPVEQRENVLVYFKHRNKNDLLFVKKFLNLYNVKYTLFSYDDRYNEDEFVTFLQNAKYGIWIDAHESQGFALQETLSCDVPLLVWNINSMSQEYGSSYDIHLQATTIPYWNHTCGEYFYHVNELEDKFNLFLSKLNSYKPREFIINNLSVEVCENKLIELVNNLKI